MNTAGNEFFVLSVNRKRIDLYRVRGQEVEELKPFPVIYEDDYEYARSSRGTSFGYSAKGFEKDKGIMKEKRFIDFLRHSDEKLKVSLPDRAVLVVAGTDKDRADFKRVSDCKASLAGEVHGSFARHNFNELITSAKEIVSSANAFSKK